MISPTIHVEAPESSGESAKALLLKAKRVAREVARPAAARVDREARFPLEAVSALREEKLLASGIPAHLGGLGCSMTDLSAICTELGKSCAATGMIFAMHQMQIVCMARHAGNSSFFHDYLRDAATHQWLVASGTSEAGVGGDLRSSIAHLEPDGDSFKLQKSCTTLSYGEYADAILITARRDGKAASGDQALALIRKEDYTLEQTGEWDVLGMRGTCSPPFTVSARASTQQVLPEPFRDIAIQTMIPYSHLLWASVWLGIAADAVGTAQSLIKQTARKSPKTMPLAAPRLADTLNDFQQMKALVRAAVREFDRLSFRPSSADTLASSSYALRINSVKLAASQLVGKICLECLGICGLAGYANNSPFSLGRQSRDALSAPLMISNNRINQTNAGLLLIAGNDFLDDI
jgi:acyl-CoA dehydrogenase